MVHTIVISVLGMQIKVDLWGSLDRQPNPLQVFLALERPSMRKSWVVPEKTPKVFFCPPYGRHIPTHLHSGERGEYTRIMWQKCGSKSAVSLTQKISNGLPIVEKADSEDYQDDSTQ